VGDAVVDDLVAHLENERHGQLRRHDRPGQQAPRRHDQHDRDGHGGGERQADEHDRERGPGRVLAELGAVDEQQHGHPRPAQPPEHGEAHEQPAHQRVLALGWS
jgi:hypothetical protein